MPDEEQFIKLTSSATIQNKWLKTDRHLSTFQISNIERAGEPLEVLRLCFSKAIKESIEQSRAHTGEPDKLGIGIQSDVLLKGPLWIPIHKITSVEESVEQIIRLLEKMSYPEEKEGQSSIFSSPMKIDITSICQKQLRELVASGQRPFTIGGRGRRKIKTDLMHSYSERGLIRIGNQDAFCLFYACEMARLNTIMKNRDHFYRYKTSQLRQYQQARQLMIDAGIPLNLTEYDAIHYLPIVQNYYDRTYPHQFRIYLFHSIGSYKPLHLNLPVGTEFNTHPLILWHEENHFDVISSIQAFFGAPYCWSCQSTYRLTSQLNLTV
jgi:hypothetical protein